MILLYLDKFYNNLNLEKILYIYVVLFIYKSKIIDQTIFFSFG